MIDLKKHTNIALGYFLLVGLLGIFLRSFFVTSIPANFRYVVHAHSHIALLGWVYIGLSTLIYKMYFSETDQGKTYRRIFWFTQVTLLGMLFTFPFTGYAALSITFSTLFLFASYLLTWFVLKKIPEKYRSTFSFKCIRASLWYLVISSIGPWALGGIMATLGKASIWYKMAIYFYLHFQYNGWFLLALCGIFLYFMERKDFRLSKKSFQIFFRLLNMAVILSFFLSVLWVKPHWIFYVLGVIGAILQIGAFFVFFRMIKPFWKSAKPGFSPFEKFLLKLAGITLVAKMLMQLISAHPYFAEIAFTYKDLVIGYLHWVFLGMVSIPLMVFLMAGGLLKASKLAFSIYIAGFILSEALIFYKGTALWLKLPFIDEYFKILLTVSSLLPISIGMILYSNLRKK